MKIYQIVDTLNFGDAIGNDVVAIKHVIEEMGIETEIYANSIAEKVKEPGAYKFSNMPKIDDDDIVIYHMASGSAFNKMTAELNCRKIMIYQTRNRKLHFTGKLPEGSALFRKRWSGKITSKRWRRSTTSALKTSAGWWEPMPPRPGLHSL